MTVPSGVIFDLGGVVLDSPLHEIARFERDHGIDPGLINETVMRSGAGGAWAAHERGELDRPAFVSAFEGELATVGVEVDVGDLLRRVDSMIRPRPAMVRAVGLVRAAGWVTAALTNNWTPFPDDEFRRSFDVFVESVVEGVRKPERAMYELCLDRMRCSPGDVVMLDDLGSNLKPARAMGMRTIKVSDPIGALVELGDMLGVSLVGA
jgi:putative hydrolase of the HAD superfamily